MILLSIPLLTSAAAAGLVATATIYNTAETYAICKKDASSTSNSNSKDSSTSILDQYKIIGDDTISVPTGKSKDDIINDLKAMRRRDVLEIFKRCEVPEQLDIIDGEWDGLLLNNNYVLVSQLCFVNNMMEK